MTLAAYTSMRIGISSCTKRPTTTGLERSNSVLSGGVSFGGVTFEDDAPSSTSVAIGSTAGDGVGNSPSGVAASTATESRDVGATPELCVAWRAAALSAFAFALIKRAKDFSV